MEHVLIVFIYYQVANHKQLLIRLAVGSLEYKQITDVLKAVERLRRITAQLPLEDTNGANPEAPEDTGQGVYNYEDHGKGYTTVRTSIRCDYP